jgi:hypothetical protein
VLGLLLLLSWLLLLLPDLLTATQKEPTVKSGITGHSKDNIPVAESTTGAATTRVTAPAAVVKIFERSTIIYNTTKRCITN